MTAVTGATISFPSVFANDPAGTKHSDLDFFKGRYSQHTIIGASLPGWWRPFAPNSPWNTPIAPNARVHPYSDEIIAHLETEAKHIRFAELYAIPVWVINGDNIPAVKVRSDRIFDFWDKDRDGWSDDGAPIAREMWAEPTADGHLCVIDPFRKVSWEFSRYKWPAGAKNPTSTTFNIWDLAGSGMGISSEGQRWQLRGGRGSGFPLIAGLLRPEEVASGTIRHALVFTFRKNRRADDGSNMFLPPASRSDGKYIGKRYPIEGMRFQLDPSLTEKDFDSWGLNREARIVARALQVHGMYLGDNGGAMAVQMQLLAPSREQNLREWEKLFPGFFSSIKQIPVSKFKVIYTGEAILRHKRQKKLSG